MGGRGMRSVLAMGIRLTVLWSVLSSSVCLAGESLPSYSQISWLTAHYPPATWQDVNDGTPQGIFIDILRAIVKDEVDINTVAFHPWPRSFHLVSTRPMTSLFAISNAPERRKIMKFSDTVLTSKFVILGRKSVIAKLKASDKISPSYQIGLSTMDKAPLAYLTVGVVNNDVVLDLMHKNTIVPKSIVRSSSFEVLAHRMQRGRIDAIAFNEAAAAAKLKALTRTNKGLDVDQFGVLFVLAEKPIAFAFHKDVPQALIDRFNADLAKLKAAGTVDAFVEKHLR